MFVIHDTVTTTHWARNQWTPSASYSPLSSVQELHVGSGVCSKLEAVDSADQGVGCDAVGSWPGMPGARLVSRNPVHIVPGHMWKPRPDSLRMEPG